MTKQTKVIEVRYVNDPKPGKQWGSIKDFEDTYYWVKEDQLGRFSPKGSYKIEYEESDTGGKFVRAIVEDVSGSPASSSGGTGKGPSSGGSDPFREQKMAAMGFAHRYSHAESTPAELTALYITGAKAWKAFEVWLEKGDEAVSDSPDPLDDLPPGWSP